MEFSSRKTDLDLWECLDGKLIRLKTDNNAVTYMNCVG